MITSRARGCRKQAKQGDSLGYDMAYGYWSKFPIIRGPIFGFPFLYGALYIYVPPFGEQEFLGNFHMAVLSIRTKLSPSRGVYRRLRVHSDSV